MMARWYLKAFIGLSLLAPYSSMAAEELRFVTCPIYRDADAGRKSGCWLGDDPGSGLRYDFTLAPSKPLLGRKMLVEGFVNHDISPDACGSVVLHPVRVSWLDGDCTDVMLPAENFKGHVFKLPRRNVRPLYESRKPIPKPHLKETFYIPFDFGRDFVIYQISDYYIDQASKYAIDTKAKRVDIVGFAATSPSEVNGVTLQESQELARRRAEVVHEWFIRFGFDPSLLHVSVGSESTSEMEGADGLLAASQRRVEITVTPQ